MVRVKRPRPPTSTNSERTESKPKAKRAIARNPDKLPVAPAPAPIPAAPAPQTAPPSPPPPASPPSQPQSQTQPTKTDSGSSGSKIVIPTSDTPINRKNAKYRKAGGGARRSSVTMRGRRASSMMSDGIVGTPEPFPYKQPEYSQSPVKPHPELDATEFYKHINQEELEHQRMRHLLSWCCHRALEKDQEIAKKTNVPRGSAENVQNIGTSILPSSRGHSHSDAKQLE